MSTTFVVGAPLRVRELVVAPISRERRSCGAHAGALWLLMEREPVAVVIRGPAGARAFLLDGSEQDPRRFFEALPGLERVMAAAAP